jgi:cytochrome c oxidase subunit 3
LWLLVNVLLALITVAFRWQIWRSLNYTGRSNSYGSIVWTILGFHTFDYVAGILESIGILIMLFAGYSGENIRKAIDFDSYTWYFVVAIWIPLHAVIFIWPLFPKI